MEGKIKIEITKDELELVDWVRVYPKLLRGLYVAKYTFKDDMIGNVVLNFKRKGVFAKYDLHVFPQ